MSHMFGERQTDPEVTLNTDRQDFCCPLISNQRDDCSKFKALPSCSMLTSEQMVMFSTFESGNWSKACHPSTIHQPLHAWGWGLETSSTDYLSKQIVITGKPQHCGQRLAYGHGQESRASLDTIQICRSVGCMNAYVVQSPSSLGSKHSCS